jgi:predicted Zn-dependent protease
MMMSERDAKTLTQKILGLSQAGSCIVTLEGDEGRHLRFAQNMATTSGAPSSLAVSVESHFGKRSGSASGTDLSQDGLAALVRASEDIAQRAPENPEFMPPLGPQKYPVGAAFANATRDATPEQLASAIAPVLREAQAKKLQASGYLEIGTGFSTFATSNGLFVYDRGTNVLQTVSARTPDGTGSGWAGTTHVDFSKLDAAGLGSVAIDKALRSQRPNSLEPGQYTVILEPSAVSDLVGTLVADEFDQRSADEGRNFATKKGGGSLVGEKIFGENVTVYSDPADPVVPGSIYSSDGMPAEKTMWIEKGVLRNLQCGRFWAQKSGRAPVPGPTTLSMTGGTTSMADMIKQVRRGLLFTRFWYIREVDPQTVLLTGLTRDGVFLIEHGAIVRPVHNFRFNESPVAMLNKVRALGPAVRTYGEEGAGLPICVPPLLVDEFTLSSVSDAV